MTAALRLDELEHYDPQRLLWSAPDLSYLLHRGQEELHALFYKRGLRRTVFLCSRRYGKSMLGCTLAIEAALRHPHGKVRIAAATAKEVRSIVEPHMRRLLVHCPPGLKPEYSRQEGVWRFPNGAEIHAAGCDAGNAERLRGTDMVLGIVEEAGTVDDLEYVVQDILLPQTITTDGRLLLIGTPPRSPAHPFTAVYVLQAESKGELVLRTIHDAPHITADKVAEYCEESGGEQSTTWRREYLCEIVVDEESAVVPEFSREEEHVVEERELPTHYVPLVAMDVGYSDLTVAVAGYYDFRAGVDVITHERVFRHATSDVISAGVRAMEVAAFGGQRVRYRVVDAPEIVVADLCRMMGIPRDRNAAQPDMVWSAAEKDDAEAALNALRLRIREHKLRIHPRCTHLRAHLRHAIWTKSRRTYERSGDHGHFDGVDAAKYFVRHLDRHTNPFPLREENVKHETHKLRPHEPALRPFVRALRGRRP